MTETAGSQACVGLVGVLLVFAGSVKAARFSSFRDVVSRWNLFRGSTTTRAASIAIPVGEVLVGVAALGSILWAPARLPAEIVCVVVLSAFTVGQVAVLRANRGRAAPCGCFARETSIGAASLSRAAGLALFAAFPLVLRTL